MGLQIKSNNRPALASGLTIIELLVVVAIIAALAGAAEPVYRTFVVQIESQNASTAYVQMLRRAMSLAQAGRGDSGWGVTLATSSITLFKGTAFATRDSKYDEVYIPNAPITVAGLTEVDFSPLTGTPKASGTTTITSGPQTATITINAKGIVTY